MRLFLTCLLAIAFLVPSAKASIITGGNGIMSQAYGNQVETWLNQGPLEFTSIFSANGSFNPSLFHAAADGKGPTITVVEVLAGALGDTVQSQVIGGYNPQSWSSIGDYNISGSVRDAFLFNLTSNVIQNQNTGLNGTYQTYNYLFYGPTFGGGHDLWLDPGNISSYTYNFSYGGTSFVNNILTGVKTLPDFDMFTYGRIDVFTFAPANINTVPEPASFAIFGICAVGCVIRARRKKS